MGYESGKVEASITLSEASKKTVIVNADIQGGVGSKTLGTVPAGKVWRIMHLNLSGGCGATVGNGGYLTLNGVKALYLYGQVSTTWGGVSATYTYENAPVLTAAQTAVLTVPAGATNVSLAGGIGYIEETA